ncbi:MAG: InlB B-repeat-containing protein [Kiritimatiellia bacterium]
MPNHKKLSCLLAGLCVLFSSLEAFASPPSGAEAIACEVKTVPYVNDASFTTWGNQQTTKPDATEVCLFKNLKLTDIVGFSATSYRAFGSYAFKTWAIDTLYAEKPEQSSRNNYDFNGFYFFTVAEDGQTATLQVQTKYDTHSGQLLMVEFVILRQEGDDIWGCVRGMKYCYDCADYGDDCTAKANSNANKYYYDDDAMNLGHAVANYSLQDFVAYRLPEGTTYTVTFVGMDGATIGDPQTLAYGEAAVAPDPPAVEGYVFWKWDTDFSNVVESMTVTALYHKLFTVTFKDADGSVLATETVEESFGATAPDMAGKEDFLGWDVDFDVVTEDLVVTALYGNPPDIVTEVVETGLLNGVSNALIFGAEDGIWNSANSTWYTPKGVATKWKEGAIAVIPVSGDITISGEQSVGGIILLLHASKVSFSGDPITFTGSAEMLYHVTADVTFNNDIGGTAGFTQNAAEGVVSPVTEFAGNYAVAGAITVNAGTIAVVGEGTLFGGSLVASGSSCANPIIIGDEGTFLFDSAAAQTIATLLNATNEGSGYSTIKKCVTKGRFVVGPNARQVVFKCGSEGLHRFYNGVDIYGTVTLADGTYHLFNENTFGMTIQDGGVLNVGSGYDYYGHRDQIVTCLAGGTINYTKVQSMGTADNKATFDGGTGNFTADYSSSNSDIAMASIFLKNGGSLTGTMMTWGWSRNTCTLTVDGTTPSAISLEKIRFGQAGVTAASNKKMQEILVVQDATGNADADLVVSSTLYKHATAVCGEGAEPYFGIVKQGTGTVSFSGESPEYGASLTIEAGTVAFAPTAVFGASTLIVNGDATIDVAMGAKLTFADSSAMAWTEGAKLSFTGDFGTRSVRIGTSADSLTGDQLASLQYVSSEGKTRPLGIDEEGYLLPPLPRTFFIIR